MLSDTLEIGSSGVVVVKVVVVTIADKVTVVVGPRTVTV